MLSTQAWLEISHSLHLTKREIQIIQGVFDNAPEGVVAQSLTISEHTVHTHLNRIFKKLHVTTRTEMVLRIVEELFSLTLSQTGPLPPICRIGPMGGCALHPSMGPPTLQQRPASTDPKQIPQV